MAQQNGSIQREMRLVEMEDGWATAIEADTSVMALPMGVMLASAVGGVGALVATDNPIAMTLIFGSVFALLAFPAIRFERIRLRAHGLELSKLYSRSQVPKIDQIRSGTGGRFLATPSKDVRELPFSDMRALGYTDYSLWFDMNGERVEVVLERTARADIQRLHDEIAQVWERYRAGLTDSEEEAKARRAQLKAVASRTSEGA